MYRCPHPTRYLAHPIMKEASSGFFPATAIPWGAEATSSNSFLVGTCNHLAHTQAPSHDVHGQTVIPETTQYLHTAPVVQSCGEDCDVE
ncbi:hypothetical protein C7212DRAFT_322407 [Tuber magnatum]|uniref:Uncharacterized protein n=1 Tax=Tuber magnatum TaxID=42249 RepID=A0A317SLY8_9PEZI|nr:hypothetical protein C7212DRAFT_322406 [Tuber magnatum]PWW75480.1 hypothetical protein C7212DRAFT_322407 [Tuber magnatum]